VRVTSVQNATLADDGATVTILSDDVPPPPAPSLTSPLHTGGAAGQTGGGTAHPPSGAVTPTGTAGSGATDLLGPVMRLGYAGLTAKGKAKLRVECPETEQGFCSGRLRLHAKLRGRDVTLGTATFSHIRGGTVEIVKVSLSRRARRTLRLADSFSVKVRARDASGNVATTDPVFAT
jgi:hypothetical protein